MKTRKMMILGFSLLVVSFFAFYACQKDTSTSDVSSVVLASESTTAQDDAGVTEISNNVTDQLDNTVSTLDANGYNSSLLKSGELGSQCMTVQVDHPDSTVFPKVITITFESCSDSVGAAKTGTIVVTLSDRFWKLHSSRMIRFENFSVNGFKFQGYKSVENMGFVNGYLNWNVVDSFKVVFPNDSTTITRYCERTRVLQTAKQYDENSLTSMSEFAKWWRLNWWHAMYKVTETGTGTNRYGDALELSTVSPLYMRMGCKHILAGDLLLVNTTRDRKTELNWGTDPNVSCGMNTITITVTDSVKHMTRKHLGHWEW